MKTLPEILQTLKEVEELPELEKFRVRDYLYMGGIKKLLDRCFTPIVAAPIVDVMQNLMPTELILKTDRFQKDLYEFLVSPGGVNLTYNWQILTNAGYKVSEERIPMFNQGEVLALLVYTAKGPLVID